MMRQNSGGRIVAMQPQKPFRVGFILVGVVLLGLLVLSACGGGGPAVTDEQRIVNADAQFRRQVTRALEGAAGEFGVSVDTNNFAAGVLRWVDQDGDKYGIIVNAGIRGVENLTLDDLRQGADVMFSFVQFEDGRKGFFVTRVRQQADGKWVADIRTLDGSTVTVEDVRVDEDGPPEKKVTFSWWSGHLGFCIDFWRIKACIEIEVEINFEPKTQGGYEDQVSEASTAVLNTVWESLRNRSKDDSKDIIFMTRDDALIAAQIHTGVSSWTLDQLSERPPLTIYAGSASGRKIVSARFVKTGENTWTSPDLPGSSITTVDGDLTGRVLGCELRESEGAILFRVDGVVIKDSTIVKR